MGLYQYRWGAETFDLFKLSTEYEFEQDCRFDFCANSFSFSVGFVIQSATNFSKDGNKIKWYGNPCLKRCYYDGVCTLNQELPY